MLLLNKRIKKYLKQLITSYSVASMVDVETSQVVFCSSDYSDIDSLHQTSFGPSSYTLSWEVKNTSSISMFRVYHEGLLQGTTLLTKYFVGGLLPCQKYQAKVEALCGENVLMSVQKVTAHTGNAQHDEAACFPSRTLSFSNVDSKYMFEQC